MKKIICVVEDEKALNDLVSQYLIKEGYLYGRKRSKVKN